MVTVSVIIPTWNRADILPRAIKSVLNQTFKDFELIIVDDMSSDNTKEVVKSFKNDRIKYIKLNYTKTDSAEGSARAKNTGIKNAKGRYIAFLDSDDEWLPTKLEEQVQVFDKTKQNVGVVYTTLIRKSVSGKHYIPRKGFSPTEGDLRPILRRTNIVSTITAMVRKECFKKCGGFDTKMPKYQEWELWVRIAEKYEFRHIDRPLAVSYEQQESISTNPEAKVRALTRMIKKHKDKFKQDPKALAFHYYTLGKQLIGWQDGDSKIGRKYLVKSLKICPLNLAAFAILIASLFGKKCILVLRKI